MKRSLMAALLVSQLGQGAMADPPDWAKDAVDTLKDRGIMQGYPDGSVGGDRPASRNEMAELIERLDSQTSSEQAGFASKSELDETREQASGLTEGIEALDVRVENLEANSDRLLQRRDEVRRPSL